MTLTINVFVALLIALGISVGLFLIGGRQKEKAARALDSAEAALATVGDPASREAADARARRWENSLAPVFRRVRMETALVRATALRLGLARRMVPLALFLIALGALAGFVRRDRARDLVLYSSVTFSYLGKFMVLAGIAFGTFVAISPFSPPVWTLYPAAGIAALGAATYIGNLPPKL